MAEEQLRKALALMKQGKKQEASRIAQAVLKQDRNNVNAWWLAANLFSDHPERQKKALERVLAINPLHKGALKMQEGLERGESVGYQSKSERQQAKPSQQVMTTQEIEFDWSKLEARDAKKKETPAIEHDKAARIAYMAMGGFALVIIAAIAIFIVVPAVQDYLVPPPDKVTISFYETFFAGDFDGARELVCSDQLEQYEQISTVFASVLENTTWEFTDLKAAIREETADTALVNISGTVSITIDGTTTTTTIAKLAEESNDDTLEPLKLEDGQWCIAEMS